MTNLNDSIFPKRDFKTAFEWHLYHVFNDPDFIKAGKQLRERPHDSEAQIELAEKYHVNKFHVIAFLEEFKDKDWIVVNSLDLSPLYSIEVIDFESDQFINISLYPHVTQKSFLELWDEIAKAKKQLDVKTRYRPPENHALVYAVFKARKRFKFSEIFKLYSEGKLPGYKGSTIQYTSEDSLERYYNKYKPRVRTHKKFVK